MKNEVNNLLKEINMQMKRIENIKSNLYNDAHTISRLEEIIMLEERLKDIRSSILLDVENQYYAFHCEEDEKLEILKLKLKNKLKNTEDTTNVYKNKK